jgi:hypothetical protein
MPIDLAFNLALGLGFAYCARDRVRTDGPFAFPAFPLLAAFTAIVVMPVALYLYLAHPSWSWMYLVDPGSVPGIAVVPMLTLHGGAIFTGWYGGARLLRAGRERLLLYAVVAAPIVLLVTLALAWGRLGRYGSYGEFHDGRALALMEVKLGYVLIGLMIGIAAAAGFTGVELLRDSRRVRTR